MCIISGLSTIFNRNVQLPLGIIFLSFLFIKRYIFHVEDIVEVFKFRKVSINIRSEVKCRLGKMCFVMLVINNVYNVSKSVQVSFFS